MEDIYNLVVNNFYGILIVFARVTGIFTFNPIFSRANIPNRIKVEMSVVLTVFMLSCMEGVVGYIPSSIVDFIGVLLREAVVGLILGFMVNLILTVLIYAGEMIDNQIGFGMAKAMDPGTGVSMPVFANVYYYMFILYFFLTDGHLAYIKLFKLSYEALPVGFQFTEQTRDLMYILAEYFATVMELAAKFAMPIVAVELIVEFVIGVLMKAVPTIQVFVVNIQLKIFVGLFLIMALAGPMSDFLDGLLEIMWTNLFSAYPMIGA